MARQIAQATRQLETDDVRVTRWDFPPGAETGHHRHAYDYVIVPLSDGPLTVESRTGVGGAIEVASVDLATGASYHRQAGVEHNVVNDGDGPFSFVEIELLQRPG